MDDLNDRGEWTGTCEKCGTSHDGYPPGTLGAVTRCLRLQADALGMVGLVDQIDALDRDVAAQRDAVLRAEGLIP